MAVKSRFQYEPLVTPKNWRDDEKRFAIRLTQIIDDLYAKVGRKSDSTSSTDRDFFEEINEKIEKIEKTKLNVDQGISNAGRLFYIGNDGLVVPLSVGNGLVIFNGMLTLTSEVAFTAICGSAMCGKTVCGGMN
jgi:hypothetical protein